MDRRIADELIRIFAEPTPGASDQRRACPLGDLPPLRPRTIYMARVLHPRFPAVSDRVWRRSMTELRRLLYSLFALSVELVDQGTTDAVALFRKAAVPPRRRVRSFLARLLPPASQRSAFVAEVQATVKSHRVGRVADYLSRMVQRTRGAAGLAEAIVAAFENRLRAGVENVAGLAGRLVGAFEFTSLDCWTRVTSRHFDADLVVTNVPLIYGYRDGTALHALVRGGVIGGYFAEAARSARSGETSVVTTHPLVGDDPLTASLRGERLPRAMLPQALGALMAHEVVHLMFGVDDNYIHERCLMRPPPDLDYHRAWQGIGRGRPCRPCNQNIRLSELLERVRLVPRLSRRPSAKKCGSSSRSSRPTQGLRPSTTRSGTLNGSSPTECW